MFDSLYISYVIAVTILMAIPGPNIGLVIANCISHSYRYGIITALGGLSAMALQLAVIVFGMAAVLSVMAGYFEWLRWAGVLYLLYIGFKALLSHSDNPRNPATAKKSLKYMYWQGFLVSATNPKTLMFFGAFLPQFVRPEGDITAQLTLLAMTTLIIAFIVDNCWCLSAHRMRPLLSKHSKLKNQLTGGFLISAAAGLALARKS